MDNIGYSQTQPIFLNNNMLIIKVLFEDSRVKSTKQSIGLTCILSFKNI